MKIKKRIKLLFVVFLGDIIRKIYPNFDGFLADIDFSLLNEKYWNITSIGTQRYARKKKYGLFGLCLMEKDINDNTNNR